jgi:hypothetical protein
MQTHTKWNFVLRETGVKGCNFVVPVVAEAVEGLLYLNVTVAET